MKVIQKLILSAVFLGCVASGKKPVTVPVQSGPTPPVVYQNEALGCALTVPPGWGLKTDVPGRLAVFTHPEGLAQGELFYEKLAVSSTPREFGLALHKRLAGSLKSLGKDKTYGQRKAYVASYVMPRGSDKLRYRLYATTEGQRAFVITCVAPVDRFEDFQDIFEEVFAGFRVK